MSTRVIGFWIAIAAAVLVASTAVHVSTWFGFDPIAAIPGVMLLHVAIFPPFGAAIYYANKTAGPTKDNQARIMKQAPRWMRVTCGVLFAYAIVNFILFMVLNGVAAPREKDGKFEMHSHGKFVRAIDAAEFHRQQAYVVRGFSGHWMIFSAAAVMMLTGAANLRRSGAPVPVPPPPPAPGTWKSSPDPEPTTLIAAVLSLVLYAACLFATFSKQAAWSVPAVIVLAFAAVLSIHRRRGFPAKPFESVVGCLSIFPNAFFASMLGNRLAEFSYVAIFAGLVPAVTGSVRILRPEGAATMLSTRQMLHTQVWGGMNLVVFAVFAVGTIGLTYLTEQVGRLLEVRRRRAR